MTDHTALLARLLDGEREAEAQVDQINQRDAAAAIRELQEQIEAEREDHRDKREQLTTAFIQDQNERKAALETERKAREEWEQGIRYHDGKNAYWENRTEASESRLREVEASLHITQDLLTKAELRWQRDVEICRNLGADAAAEQIISESALTPDRTVAGQMPK